MDKCRIGFKEALKLTLDHIRPLKSINLPISDCESYITAESVVSMVNSPSTSTAMKDGYAVRLGTSFQSDSKKPDSFRVCGVVAAGQKHIGTVSEGTTLRILTGAPIPEGADTVVAEEFTRLSYDHLLITEKTPTGKNILAKGSDTAVGEELVKKGQLLTPGRIGLLAAGGHDTVRVYKKPDVALIATGDEVVLPGENLTRGKLYASNLITLNGWCLRFGFRTDMDVVGDNTDKLYRTLEKAVKENDAVVTSGGAWTGDRDLMAGVLDALGWEKRYHRVRLGPGKGVGFGLLNHKPVFILPGGPPSNLAAFLQLALPGLLRLSGQEKTTLPVIPATLDTTIVGKKGWTRAIFGDVYRENTGMVFKPHGRPASRLKSMADARAILLIAEDVSEIAVGETVTVQMLDLT